MAGHYGVNEEFINKKRTQNSHSPLLTKRKIFQKRGGNNTTRGKLRDSNKDKYVKLNNNLRRSSQRKDENRSTERPPHCKLGSEGSNKILTNDAISNRMSEEALANADIIINKLSEKK